MTRTLRYTFLAAVFVLGAVCSAEVLLYDTFADGSRTETSLPTQSAVWFSHPANLTVSSGSLAVNQLAIGNTSSKMWTYFAPNGSPVSLGVGDKLIAEIRFTPRGAMYSTTSKNFRLGLFYDPTDAQLLQDTNSDNGGGRWYDSRGYAVMFTLSPDSTAGTIQVGKRTNVTGTDGLLSSTGTYTWNTGSGQAANLSLNTQYTMKLVLERTAEAEMKVTFTFLQGSTVIASNTLTDNGLGSLPIYTSFDQLFFRLSTYTGTADIVDYNSIKIEKIPAAYGGPLVGVEHVFTAVQSCRTELFDGVNPRMNDNRTDGSKLSVRSDEKAAKSWIKFDLSSLEPEESSSLRAAILKITSITDKTGTTQLSYVKDSCLDNIGWTETTLTWNNAPGNIPSNDGQTPADPSFTVTDLRANLDPAKAAFLAVVDYSSGCVVGDSFTFDAMPAIQEDSDGIVQFVLHGATGLINFATHDHATVAYRPTLTILLPPLGADWPIPYQDQTVQTSLAFLQWTNPEPNLPSGTITCDVYLGTEPNRLLMDKVTLGPDVNIAAVNAANFPHFAPLQNRQRYYWIVDVHDSSREGVLEGLIWSFYVNDNMAPTVNAGPDQITWGLPKVIALDGTASDDGLPVPPGAYTVQWTQVSGPTVSINPDNAEDASVEITAPGVYEFRLTANDGEKQTYDTVKVVVGETSCQASHLSTGQPYMVGDFNQDCIVDLEDFAQLLSKNWQNCTDLLVGCN
ncbi:MAG TPA: DNRLRE domain-containing protein [Anaerohalosphaeraceae bacterium]|nr:DNRLRE domain-containing protein [Anaerohalosphaeraceae bacterium]HOL88760.1 DNRLRE domain-containing protein [Anaerohalosphaeraceae bacterium]HPP55945.1 DNRLRE domain-containing protein [Anaerohalosphaeraceae bacterium]